MIGAEDQQLQGSRGVKNSIIIIIIIRQSVSRKSNNSRGSGAK